MATDRRPNILLITCHDLGRFLGCYGVSTVRTPQLDALAADGVRFARAFCTAPQCSPSRASLFTGRYPHSNGVLGLTHAQFAWDLHPDERHLGQTLRDAGYTTALLGIHHESLRAEPAAVAARCGMDEVVLGGRAEEVAGRALERLGRFAEAERPFYLQLGFHEPHREPTTGGADREELYMGFLGDRLAPDDALGVTVPPYLRDEPRAREELAELQGAIHYVDGAIGRVLAGLRDLGLVDNTLVLVTTDHGLALPRAKCSLYDPGLEIALILRLPARGWRGGRAIDALVSNVDLFPTLVELAGLPVPPAVQGRSLLALLDGEDGYEPRDAIFGEMTYHDYYDPRRGVRTARHKLIVNFSAAPAFMDPSQSWRPRTATMVPPDPALAYHPPVELYDLEADPLEWRNLADDEAHAAPRRALLAQLGSWMRETGDPLLAGAVTSPLHRRVVAALAGAGDPAPG
ncbi:MAG: Sulfatase family protein [uncultured Thermomicrobiales bacterium]|uniref:Sulfatase family protein n=1 Tax=uncultured Thermomicrobiales bacterium TaxID=1645740 RepID=A0A6J4UHP2_9BACT|nr:MAG: Sulfatase family protein [uncultured Thermomicrobiales bacterium]